METHIARALHEDHMVTLAFLERLEALLARHRPGYPPVAATPAIAALLRDCERTVASEIGQHFDFEEAEIFPRLAAAGADAMVHVLIEEHEEIRPLAQSLVASARQGEAHGFVADIWAEFHAAAATFASQLEAHIAKEEMGLLPVVDDIIDMETDSALSRVFANQR